jgi:dihydrolipoamide dehydrogenase
MQHEYDLIVLGGGPAGKATAAHAADAGLDVALVESGLVGGECPYVGCMPSKALLRPGQVLTEARRVPGAAEAITGPIDIEAALRRRDASTYELDDSSHSGRVAARGVTIVRGRGALVAERRVRVEPSSARPGEHRSDIGEVVDAPIELTARRAVAICTGTHALVPPIDGLDQTRCWTNVEGTLARTVPTSLIVLGGGPIGCELAQAWHSLGCEHVTIVELGDRLLAREEPFASELLETNLREAGIDVRTGVGAVRVERPDGATGDVVVHLGDGSSVTGAELLVAVGRAPNTAGIGLEAVDAPLDPRGFLPVDDCMRVAGSRWLFAIGDVNGRALFTHTATYHAQIAARNIAGDDCECVDDLVGAPRVTYTEPQVAAAGMTSDMARERQLDVIVVDRDIHRLAAASFYGKGEPARARLVIDRASTRVLGATFVGPHVAELLHAATIAISAELRLEQLRHAVAPFPTLSQIWPALTDEAARQLAAGPASDD